MNEREERLKEIEEELRLSLMHNTDCEDADHFQKYTTYLISELKSAWEREKITETALKEMQAWGHDADYCEVEDLENTTQLQGCKCQVRHCADVLAKVKEMRDRK